MWEEEEMSVQALGSVLGETPDCSTLITTWPAWLGGLQSRRWRVWRMQGIRKGLMRGSVIPW